MGADGSIIEPTVTDYVRLPTTTTPRTTTTASSSNHTNYGSNTNTANSMTSSSYSFDGSSGKARYRPVQVGVTVAEREEDDDDDDDDENNNNHDDNVIGTNDVTADPATTTTTTTTTWFDCCMHLIKGNLGPGCLNLPHAFVLSGWLLGLTLFVVVVLQGVYSMTTLVYCKQRCNTIDAMQPSTTTTTTTTVSTFMDVTNVAFGRWGSRTVQLLLFVLQAGVCCVFLSLLATNLHASLDDVPTDLCVLLVTCPLLVVVLIQSLRDLRWLSTVANVFMVTAIVTATVAAISELLDKTGDARTDRPSSTMATSDWADVATFVSAMFFSFEGIGLVLPVENSYVGDGSCNDERRAFVFRRYILPGSMSMVALLFLLVGLSSSFAFTDNTSGSITAYLTETFPHNRWYPVVNTLVMVAVFFTFPLQLTPAMEVLEEWFGPGCDPQCFDDACCDTLTKCHGLLLVRRRRPRRLDHDLPQDSSRSSISIDDDEDEEEEEQIETVTQKPLQNYEEVGLDGLLRPAGSAATFAGGSGRRPRKQTTSDTAAVSSSSDDDENEGVEDSRTPNGPMNDRTLVGSDDNSHENEHDTFLVTVNDNHEEVTVPQLPPLQASCFGSYEWVFRRWVVVLGCAFVVLIVDDLSLLMSLFGAVGQTGLAMTPCAVHWKLQRQGIVPPSRITLLLDGFTIAFSLVVMITGVVFSVQGIVAKKDDQG